MKTIFELFFAAYGAVFAICFFYSLYEDYLDETGWFEAVLTATFMGIVFPPYLIYAVITEEVIPFFRRGELE